MTIVVFAAAVTYWILQAGVRNGIRCGTCGRRYCRQCGRHH